MDQNIYESYLRILKTELVPAFGCTEPIALAYAAAKAREVLGDFPDTIKAYCSGNIIKNVRAVKIPNSNGLKGVKAAVILGALVGESKRELEILESVTSEQQTKTKELLDKKFCECILKEGVENLYVTIRAQKGNEVCEVTIENGHTNITLIKKNGETLFQKENQPIKKQNDKALLNIKDIVTFAKAVLVEDVKELFDMQISYNLAIAKEGLDKEWGAQIGRTLLEEYGSGVKIRAVAKAAAGSDARMGGSPFPVVINSGSGNQGITCSIPVIEYANELGKSKEELYRALCIANLTSQNQKRYIGALSAYCGVVCAAAGAGAGITYLCGGTIKQIEDTVINTIANIGGMVCDGAKASCAAKVSSALQAAILGHNMAMKGITFEAGDGLVQKSAQETIKAIGYVGKEGMKQTDIEILNVMIGNRTLE